MKKLYETKISDAKWIAYDIPANVGWIAYFVCVILAFCKYEGNMVLNIICAIPAAFMLLGLCELIGERILKLDRILPKSRLLRGFGALTLGGFLGVICALVSVILHFNAVYLIALVGALLCCSFCGLLFFGYKKKKEEDIQANIDEKEKISATK